MRTKMLQIITSKEGGETAKRTVPVILWVSTAFAAFLMMFKVSFAADTTAITTALNTVKTIGAIICFVLGAINLINGLIKLAAAKADDTGPAENKAGHIVSSAIVLFALGAVFLIFDVKWIVDLVSKGADQLAKPGA